MPRYTIIFSFQKKVGCMGKDKDPEKSSILHTGTFFLSQCKEYNLLLPLLRNGCCLVDPFAFWRFYKVLHGSIAWFWKYSNKLWGCSKPANLSFWNMKSFQQSILIKNCISDHQSGGKLTRLKTYICIWYLISEMQGHMQIT